MYNRRQEYMIRLGDMKNETHVSYINADAAACYRRLDYAWSSRPSYCIGNGFADIETVPVSMSCRNDRQSLLELMMIAIFCESLAIA